MKKLLSFFTIFIGVLLSAQIFSWKNPNLPEDSAKKDSVVSARINKDTFLRDTADFVQKSKNIPIEDAVLINDDRKKFLGDLNAKGSVIRGITFGNSQGSSVQSAMDLQITGKLSEDVSILASISDHNLPVQADGYTQTLEEFDKVYLQLNIKDKSFISAGHLDISHQQSYFARYQRRSMGLNFLTSFGKNRQTDFTISAGVARSEFFRMRFQGIEGNQGPYRLTGRNGENFITIISGSEEVYIDGILMKRGENLDYVINYNTGEITFTSFRPIYRQNFITVSYNYTNRNYSRYLITGGVNHKSERFRAGFAWFLENDNRSAPLSLSLSREDEMVLAAAGNNPSLMMANSATVSDYDVNKILYRKVSGAVGDYYEFSTDAAETLYQVSFTYMGAGSGDYRLVQSANNGRVFEFVGRGSGDYSALRKLPAPQKSQVLSSNFEYLFNDGRIGTDISLSNYDANLFSSLDNEENLGYAARIFGDKIFKTANWKAVTRAEYQHIDRRFHILDRINDVEFSRDFNLAQEFRQVTQDRAIFTISNTWLNRSFLNYRFNFLHEKTLYQGVKNDVDFSFYKGKTLTSGRLSYLDTKTPDQKTNFTRASILSEYLTPRGSTGVGGAMEHNVKQYRTLDLYDPTSFSWKEVFVQKRIADTLRTKLFAKAYFRKNDSVRDGSLQNVSNILGFMAESQIIKSEKTNLSILAHYRKQFVNDALLNDNQNRDFVVGNIVYNQQLFRNGMRLQAFYELGNGQEAQREFQYLKVTDGQGVYKWTDYNADGIQQLDEFEIAEYSDLAQYIRIYTNSISYLPSNKNKLQLAVFVNPSIVFNSENAFLKRWNFNLSLLSQNSFYKKDRVLVINPFEREDDQILKNQNFLAAAQFNPTDKSGWNGNYRFTSNENIINANFSAEQSLRTMHFLNVGYWFSRDLRADWENTLSTVKNDSELFASRDYRLKNIESRPKVTFKFTDALQSEVSAALRNKENTSGEEHLKALEFAGSLQWDHRKTSVRANFSFINNKFEGNSFSVIGNQMLDGLKPGKNQVWSLFLQQALNSFLMLNVNYEGRNSGERTIHVGSMQLKASF